MELLRKLLKEFMEAEKRRGLRERTAVRKARKIEKFFKFTGKTPGRVTVKDAKKYLSLIETPRNHNDTLMAWIPSTQSPSSSTFL